MDYTLKVLPAITPGIRHKIEAVLVQEGFEVHGGGTLTDMSECDITFSNKGGNMGDVRIHRIDCQGFDERINCVGCFKAEVMQVLRAAHDHMLMDKTGRGNASRAFRMVTKFLDMYDTPKSDDQQQGD
jgi:hypothetical protein